MSEFSATVSKEALVGALTKIVGFIPKTSASKNSVVYLEPSANGRAVSVAVSFPDLYIRSECIGEAAGDQNISVYGRKLFEIIKQANGMLDLVLEDNTLKVRCEKAQWKEPLVNGTLNVPELVTDEEVTFDPADLIEAIGRIRYAATKDGERPNLYMVDVVKGKVRASNGSNYHEVRTGLHGLTFKLGNHLVEGFLKLLTEWSKEPLPVAFSESASYYHFRQGDDTFSLKKAVIEFPDLDRLLIRPIKAQANMLLKVNRNEMLSALRKVRLSSSEKFPYVELHVSANEVLLRCLEDSGTEAVAAVRAHWDGQPRIMTFNSDNFFDIIHYADGEVLELKFAKDTKDWKSPVVIEGEKSWSLLNQLRMRPR